MGDTLRVALTASALVASACRSAPSPARPAPLKVAAAADLAFAFREIGAAYEKATGQPVTFSFGSTGALEKQIAEGAPFDVFAAASVSYVDDAIRAGACIPATKSLYATGRIVLFAAPTADVDPSSVAALIDARIRKIAIANPDHAPYGRAARQALEKAGVWDAVAGKIVYAENVQQALQFAQSGNADVAIVALSLASVTPGWWKVVPDTLHAPLDQALVVCSRSAERAAAAFRFTDLVASAQGRGIMQRFGFTVPGASPVDGGGKKD